MVCMGMEDILHLDVYMDKIKLMEWEKILEIKSA